MYNVQIWDLWHGTRPMRTLYAKFGGKLRRRSKAVHGFDGDGGRVNIISYLRRLLHAFSFPFVYQFCTDSDGLRLVLIV